MDNVFRVRFVLPRKYYMDDNRSKGHQALEKAFGIGKEDIANHVTQINPFGTMGLKIVCTAQQFAKYLILRNDMGVPNGFKDLAPKLLPPVQDFGRDPTLVVTRHDT